MASDQKQEYVLIAATHLFRGAPAIHSAFNAQSCFWLVPSPIRSSAERAQDIQEDIKTLNDPEISVTSFRRSACSSLHRNMEWADGPQHTKIRVFTEDELAKIHSNKTSIEYFILVECGGWMVGKLPHSSQMNFRVLNAQCVDPNLALTNII